MKQAFVYSLKVWVTALLLSPTIAFPIWMLAEWIISYANRDKAFSTGIAYGIDINVSTIGLSMLWFALYYLPYLFLLFFCVIYLRRRSTTMRYNRVVFTVLAIVLTLCPFTFLKVIVSEVAFNMQLARVISFGLFFIAGVWFYRLKPVTKQSTNIIF